jgi:hypothetical protein
MKYSDEPVGAIHCPPRRNHVADYWDRAGQHPCRLQAAGLGAARGRLPAIARSIRSSPAPAPRAEGWESSPPVRSSDTPLYLDEAEVALRVLGDRASEWPSKAVVLERQGQWDDFVLIDHAATSPRWSKYRACDATCAHCVHARTELVERPMWDPQSRAAPLFAWRVAPGTGRHIQSGGKSLLVGPSPVQSMGTTSLVHITGILSHLSELPSRLGRKGKLPPAGNLMCLALKGSDAELLRIWQLCR